MVISGSYVQGVCCPRLSLCEPTPSELIALEDVRYTAMAVIAEVHGTHDLRWLSSQECESIK